jgi:hypothetical protein
MECEVQLRRPSVRCAIYTRKSSEEGLQQEFNSLDAQRESAEAFIASQRGQGWQVQPELYDDGGYTGGNMERPALKRLLQNVEAGEIDCVVVYKVGGHGDTRSSDTRSSPVRRRATPPWWGSGCNREGRSYSSRWNDFVF